VFDCESVQPVNAVFLIKLILQIIRHAGIP
jgi:hypothetical protein